MVYYEYMKINCKYCGEEASVKRGYIYMKCMCDEDRRIINLNEVIDVNLHSDYINQQDSLFVS